MLRRMRVSPAMGVALVALVVACTGGAYAAGTKTGSGAIVACVHHKGGGMYVAKRCTKHDKKLRWSVRGPQGVPGASGAPGAAGAAGLAGAPATKLFAQITSTGKVNASGSPAQAARLAAGVYLINFERDISRCVAVANQGGIPVFGTPGALTAAAVGDGARVDHANPGGAYSNGFPSGDTVEVSTFAGGLAADTSFEVAAFC
jgi:membrane-associated phospholipid phosphatase